MELEKIRKLASALKVINTVIIVALCICAAALILCLFLMIGTPEVVEAFVELGFSETEVLGVLVQYTVTFGMLIAVLRIFNNTLASMKEGDVFAESSAKQLRVIGILLIINTFVPPLIGGIALALSGNGFNYNLDLTYIFIALGAYLLSWVLRYAATREQALQQIQSDLQARYEAERPKESDVFTDI